MGQGQREGTGPLILQDLDAIYRKYPSFRKRRRSKKGAWRIRDGNGQVRMIKALLIITECWMWWWRCGEEVN